MHFLRDRGYVVQADSWQFVAKDIELWASLDADFVNYRR